MTHALLVTGYALLTVVAIVAAGYALRVVWHWYRITFPPVWR